MASDQAPHDIPVSGLLQWRPKLRRHSWTINFAHAWLVKEVAKYSNTGNKNMAMSDLDALNRCIETNMTLFDSVYLSVLIDYYLLNTDILYPQPFLQLFRRAVQSPTVHPWDA